MNLQELARSVLAEYGPELVLVRLAELYNIEVNEAYHLPLFALDKFVPVQSKKPMTVHVEWVKDEDDGHSWINVYGTNGKTWSDAMLAEGTSADWDQAQWGVDTIPWAENAGLTVAERREVPDIDFVAACVWDMGTKFR